MDILGQTHVVAYLVKGLVQQRLSPSLLFVGPSGTGKRTCAIELAKCFVCEEPPLDGIELPRCGRCRGCRLADESKHADILMINRATQAVMLNEKEATQTALKIETVRHLERFLHLRPLEARRRVVILDEAHRLTNDAANAFLKLLEEPPHNAQVILLCPDEHALPVTVLSRCVVLRFRPLPVPLISDWLLRHGGVDSERAMSIAERSGGSLENASRAKEEPAAAIDISQYSLSEFFSLLEQTNWKKDGRKNAETALVHLVDEAAKNLSSGDLGQAARIRRILSARRMIDRNVPPRLVLENLFLELEALERRSETE